MSHLLYKSTSRAILYKHPRACLIAFSCPVQTLDKDVSGAISFEELRHGLALLTSPPVRISFDDWEHMTKGFTITGKDGEELLDLAGFQHLLRRVLRGGISG